jgi:hypothetical protein
MSRWKEGQEGEERQVSVKTSKVALHPALGQGNRIERHRLRDGKFLTPYLLGWKGQQSGHNKRRQNDYARGYDQIDWSKGKRGTI